MLWQFVLSYLALVSHSPTQRQNDEPIDQEFTPSIDGPQTWEEAEIARQAIHGDKYGGDMVFSEAWNASDAGMKDTRFRWPGYPGRAVIPYVIDGYLGSSVQARSLILRGMEQYHQKTCIRFVPRTNQKDYVRIHAGNGCWSMIGRVGGAQDLSLGRGCLYVGLVVHELGHAVGLYHEHQRSDRDQYINVYLNNVWNDQQHNFVKTDPKTELIYTRYDYDSIMHYGSFAFSIRPNQAKTMEAKNGHKLVEPYDKPGFTNSDIETIRKLYRC